MSIVRHLLKSIREERVIITLLFFCFGVYAYWAYFSEGSFGGADAFHHYAMSRYLWSYPDGLLTNHWGKPLFIWLSNPWAQFGYLGIRIFNILCGLSAAFFSYKTAKKLGATRPEMAALFVAFGSLGVPVYLSGLTEPLFALVLAASIYLFVYKKYIYSALLVSFIFLARSEGMLIIGLFGGALVLLKQWKSLPFLLVGTVLIGCLNWITQDEFFGYFTQMPFGNGFYGTGDLLHFFNYRNRIFGEPFQLFILLGMLLLFINWRTISGLDSHSVSWWLIMAIFFGYFAAHSYVWYTGTGSSAGLLRVMVGAFPAGAIIASVGTHYFSFIKKWIKRDISWLFLAVVAYFQIGDALKEHQIPTEWWVEDKELIKAVDFIDSAYSERPFVGFFNPIVPHLMDYDPFDSTLNIQVFKHTRRFWTQKGTIIFYDNHFGSGEAGFAHETFDNDSVYKKLKVFKTPTQHKGFDGEPFHVTLYERVK